MTDTETKKFQKFLELHRRITKFFNNKSVPQQKTLSIQLKKRKSVDKQKNIKSQKIEMKNVS